MNIETLPSATFMRLLERVLSDAPGRAIEEIAEYAANLESTILARATKTEVDAELTSDLKTLAAKMRAGGMREDSISIEHAADIVQRVRDECTYALKPILPHTRWVLCSEEFVAQMTDDWSQPVRVQMRDRDGEVRIVCKAAPEGKDAHRRLRALAQTVSMYGDPVQITDAVDAPDGRLGGGVAIITGDVDPAIGNTLDDALDVLVKELLAAESAMRSAGASHGCYACMLDGQTGDWTAGGGCTNSKCSAVAHG